MAVTVIALFPVPEAGETVSHVVLGVAAQLNVPPPALLIFRV